MIRVCQLITELRPAGAERCVLELARRLPADRFAVEVAALRGGAVADALSEAGVPVHVLDVRGKWDAPRWPALVRLLRRGRFDILHTHLFHADLAGRPAARLAGVPHVVHTVHVAERRRRPWQFLWARLTADTAGTIVCVSRGVRDFHRRRTRLPAGRYTVIHNGIDADAYARGDTLRARWRRLWEVGQDDVLCAFVGRLDRQKGLDVLLPAFERAEIAAPALRLVIAGEGPLRPAAQAWLRSSLAGPRIRLLGHVSDVRHVLSAADIFCQPSRWEGFGLAAAEAMAARLPVVATDVEGLNEVVAAGQTGLLCRPDDPEALAGLIGRLARDAELRARLGDAGRRRVLEKFTIERFIDRHAELYEALMRGPAEYLTRARSAR